MTQLILPILYIVFVGYCDLRFLNVVDRGVAARERIAEALSRGQDG